MVLIKELQNSECHESYQITNYCPYDQTLPCHHINSMFFPLRNKTLHATKHREIFWLKANKHCMTK